MIQERNERAQQRKAARVERNEWRDKATEVGERTRGSDRSRAERLQSKRERLQERRAQRRLERDKGDESKTARGEQQGLAVQERERERTAALHKRRERISDEAARRGRFAAKFERRLWAKRHAERRRARHKLWAARRAWRAGHRAWFVPRIGAVYWPYAYSDVFYFTFWPHGFVYGYWAYAYDDFFDTLFWGGGAPYSPYVYAYADPRPRGSGRRRAVTADVAPSTREEVQQHCADPGQGVTAWPIEEIEKAVQPTGEQEALLHQVRTAAAQAAEAFKASCPTTLARTPPRRLETMVARIEATLEAVRIVRPALAAFYGSLADEQKARFNEIGPRPSTAGEAPSDDDEPVCPDPKPGLAALPMDRIQETVRPTEAEQASFDQLSHAAENAVTALQAACPDFVPQTPVGRLEAMEARLGAMLEAAHIVQPALQAFYDLLGDEQKARFNTLGRELASTGG